MSQLSLCSHCGQCKQGKKKTNKQKNPHQNQSHPQLVHISYFKEKIKNNLHLDYGRKAISQLDDSSQEKTVLPLLATLSYNAHQHTTVGFIQTTELAFSSFCNCCGYKEFE